MNAGMVEIAAMAMVTAETAMVMATATAATGAITELKTVLSIHESETSKVSLSLFSFCGMDGTGKLVAWEFRCATSSR